MTLVQTNQNESGQLISRSEELQMYDKFVWKTMKEMTIEDGVRFWLDNVKNPNTRKNYESAFRRLGGLEQKNGSESIGVLNRLDPVSTISITERHNEILDKIARCETNEATRQARSAAYISFTKFLGRMFPRNFDRAVPIKGEVNATFGKVRELAKTQHMSCEQWTRWLEELHKINPRDCLIAKLILQGGRRACEVLTLTSDQIDWEKNEITYTISKTGKTRRDRYITYPESVMQKLREYMGERTGLVFITRKSNTVPMNQIQNTFAKAAVIAKIPFKVTPHVLRASCITFFRQQGFKDSDILKVTGHTSSNMISYYDKTSLKENPTQKVSLVT